MTHNILDNLRDGLVVSCQPVSGSPLDSTDIIVAMAHAAELSGAKAVRIEGVANVAAVSSKLHIPVIGIVKRINPDSPVVITSTHEDIDALAGAGADIIATDATHRTRSVAVGALLKHIKQCKKLAMADCSTVEEASAALKQGADIVGSTLSGYTEDTSGQGIEPDFPMVRDLAQLTQSCNALVMAEGRYNSPELAAAALRHGADCVTVGSAITRMEHIIEWFITAMAASK